MKKEDIDHHPYLLMQVSTLLIYICIELNNMTGVVVVILNIIHSVMVNANGSSQGTAQSASMSQKVATISYVIVR